MPEWAVTVLAIAPIAAVFGLGGIASTLAWIAQILHFVFVRLFVVALTVRATPGPQRLALGQGRNRRNRPSGQAEKGHQARDLAQRGRRRGPRHAQNDDFRRGDGDERQGQRTQETAAPIDRIDHRRKGGLRPHPAEPLENAGEARPSRIGSA